MLRGIDSDEVIPDPWEAATSTIRSVLADRGEAQAAVEAQARLQKLQIKAWADLVPEAHGPLDWRTFAFQIEPLYSRAAVEDPEQVHIKATQIGWSTGSFRLALYWADIFQWTVLYTFPTDKELADFSRERIGPIIRGSQHLRGRMTADGVDNVGQKQIGTSGWLYFRGTNKPIDSIPAEAMVYDEYDTSDQKNIAESEYRTSGFGKADLKRRLGVPSIPGFGIDELYQASDQRVWTVKCTRCNEWNPLQGYEAFLANVDHDTKSLVCRKCRKGPLDPRVGQWVAKHPDRSVKGYHAPKLLLGVPGLQGQKVISDLIKRSEKRKDYEVAAFHNRDLAEAYAPVEGRLSVEAVQACVRNELRPMPPGEVIASHGLRTMGVDMASARALNVVIEEAIRIGDPNSPGRKLWVGEVQDEPGGMTAFEKLCWIMQTYGIHMCGIDNEPDGRFAREFASRFPGRVYRCDFFTPSPGGKTDPANWNVDDAEQFVSLWRTKAYDAVFERFRMQEVVLPPLELLPWDDARGRSEYATHLGNLYKRKTMETRSVAGLKYETGQVRVDYVRTGPEDYAQAEAYNLAAIELYWRNAGMESVRGAGPTPMADSIEGFAPSDLSFDGSDPEYRPGFE